MTPNTLLSIHLAGFEPVTRMKHPKGSFQNTWNAQKIHNAQNNTQKKYEEKRSLRKLRK